MALLTKDDRYGIAGILLCSVLAWFDDWWRPFWIAAAALLMVWTAISVINRGNEADQ